MQKNTKFENLLLSTFGIFAAIFYILSSLMTASRKSAHFDETAHIMSGYFTLIENDYRLATSNMTLSQKIAALPLISISLPENTQRLARKALGIPVIHGDEVFILGLSFLNSGTTERLHSILFRSRSMMLCLGTALMISVFLYSASLFGSKGALISLAFLATCPSMISLSGIVGAEIACALFFFLSVWSFWTILHKLNPLTLLAFSASFSCLLATKISSLAFFPWAASVLILRIAVNRPLEIKFFQYKKCEIRSRPQTIAALGAAFALAGPLVFCFIWALYGFRYSAVALQSQYSAQLDWSGVLADNGIFTRLLETAKSAKLFPESFIYDLAGLRRLTHSCPAFFMGECSNSGWTLYFPTLFLAKTHLPLLIAFAASLAIIAQKSFPRKSEKNIKTPNVIYEISPIMLFIVVFMGVAMTARINIGHRHIFPIYPFIYVLLGALSCLLEKKKFLPKIFLCMAILASFASSIATFPNSLSYVSPLFGGPYKAYTKFIDSNIDWGQELPAMKKWLDENKKPLLGTKTYFSYFGSASPEKYGICAERLHGYLDPRMQSGTETSIGKKLFPGAYFVSATMLQPVYYTRENIVFPKCNFSGEWTSGHENRYREMKAVAETLISAIESAKNNPEKEKELERWFRENKPAELTEHKARQFWIEFLAAYDLARFAKLAKYLRSREPDAHINYSIYLFILNEEELRKALN